MEYVTRYPRSNLLKTLQRPQKKTSEFEGFDYKISYDKPKEVTISQKVTMVDYDYDLLDILYLGEANKFMMKKFWKYKEQISGEEVKKFKKIFSSDPKKNWKYV